MSGIRLLSTRARIVGDMPHDTDESMSAAEDSRREDLLSALEVVEGQPLSERAAAYLGLHDELARRLESGPWVSA